VRKNQLEREKRRVPVYELDVNNCYCETGLSIFSRKSVICVRSETQKTTQVIPDPLLFLSPNRAKNSRLQKKENNSERTSNLSLTNSQIRERFVIFQQNLRVYGFAEKVRNSLSVSRNVFR
jgi:hypothetical protein